MVTTFNIEVTNDDGTVTTAAVKTNNYNPMVQVKDKKLVMTFEGEDGYDHDIQLRIGRNVSDDSGKYIMWLKGPSRNTGWSERESI